MLIILRFPTSEDYYMSSSLVRHFADEKATFARGRILGHTGLPVPLVREAERRVAACSAGADTGISF